MNTLDTLFYRWLFCISNHVYQVLLAAYPSEFRRLYGRHMAQVFRDCCREAYRTGGNGRVIMLWIVALYDLGTNALGEHCATIFRHREERYVLQAMVADKQVQTNFMISSQQFPDVSLFRLLDCSCRAHTDGPLAF